ncbi:MAG: response regulator [Anaerolineae bacterium]|nr:response regulator [Anaerolineae bacterium]
MSRTILVVDDDLDTQKLLSLILTKEGFNVLTASSGPEALATVEQTPLDLVILDVMMPDMDGYEVLRRLRSNPSSSNIPVIMLSAKGGVHDRVNGLRSGADDYIPKPADPGELVARVEAVLARFERAKQTIRGRVIAFIGAKGGTGTTTLAINIGTVLAKSERVVLAELRRGLGSAATCLRLRPRYTLEDLAAKAEALTEADVQSALMEHACGLRLLAAPAGIPEMPALDPAFADSLLEHLAHLAQFVLLDLSADATFVRPLLSRAEMVVLVTNTSPVTIHNTRALIDLVSHYGLTGERCRVVLVNQAPGAGISIIDLANTLNYPVQAAIPYAAEEIIDGVRRGLPLVLHRPNHLASLTLIELAGRLTGVDVGGLGELHTLPAGMGQPPQQTSGGLFSRFHSST